MSSEIIEVWGIVEGIDADRVFVEPRVVCHSTRGPVCPSCNRQNSNQFAGSDGVLRCQHCGVKSGWMAGPREDGFLWSTWPILPNESDGE